MKQKKWIILAIIILVIFAVGMWLYPHVFSKNSTVDAVNPATLSNSHKTVLNVSARILKYENLNDIIRTTGSLLPDEEVDLSFETSGKITAIYFKEGAEVQKGTLLAKVNDQSLQAELKKLEAQIPLAEERVFRQKSLLEKDAVSQEAYEQVTTELEKLNADIELAKARILQTELRAPFDGVIGLRLVSEGANTEPTTVVARLTKIKPLKVDFSVNERQAEEIRPGLNLDFSVEGDLQKYAATIYAVESHVDIKTRTLKARALYPNENGKLQSGRSVSIEIKLREITNAISVPSEAVIAEMGRSIAYLYKNGKAQKVELTRGMRTESNVQILDGLKVGDTLIVTGVMQLRDGMDVIADHIFE